MAKPLEGLKILELSTFVAAPCTARLLADLGAEVIKIEKNSGDDWRYTAISFHSNVFTQEENPIFDLYNTGKEFITLNMKTPEGMEIFWKLLSGSDVFVTNVRQKSLEKLGIDYDSVKDKYPSLIYAVICGYGDKGPEKDAPAFDGTAFWSRCGMLRDMAIPSEDGDYMPMFPPSSVGDTASAILLVSEITAALYQRTETGKGQLVKSSLYQNGIFVFGPMLVSNQRPWGKVYPTNRPVHSIPGGSYECKDGEWIFIATGMVHILVHQICTAIGKPELEFDERFATPKARLANKNEYYKIFKEAFLTKTSDEWLRICRDLDIAATKMNHYSEVSEDEQAWANGFLEKVEYKNGSERTVPHTPFHMSEISEDETPHTKASPLPGEDNVKVLSSLGYSEKEIASLTDSGVISVSLIKE